MVLGANEEELAAVGGGGWVDLKAAVVLVAAMAVVATANDYNDSHSRCSQYHIRK